MKTNLIIGTSLAILSLARLSAQAQSLYNAPGSFTGGVGALDMSSVVVNNDANNLYFTINLNGDPTAANWYNYYIGISENLFGGVGGNLDASGGWGKNIQMSTGGMDYFIGGYPYYGGYSLLTWNGSSWNSASGVASENTSSVSFTVPLASLGLAPGNSFNFDVWSSDTGSDGVLDALSSSAAMTWNSNPFDTGANALSYTVQAVPEPATATCFGLGALLMVRRCFRRKN